ncbi:hypothetical protein MUN53_10175, partial [Parabacteroides sp. AGMB00274]
MPTLTFSSYNTPLFYELNIYQFAVFLPVIPPERLISAIFANMPFQRNERKTLLFRLQIPFFTLPRGILCHATDLLYTHLTKKEKAMGKKGISHRKFSIEFKLSVL